MNLTRPVRRVVALGLLLAVLWTTWATLASPMLDGLATDRREIGRSLQLLAHYNRLAESAPELELRRSGLLSEPDNKGFLQGTDPSLVAAEMQVTAGRLAASSGATIQSSRTLPGNEEEGFWKGEVLLELQATPGQLRQLLHEILTNQPVIFVEKLGIHVPEDGTAPLSADEQPLANVQLQLASYAILKKRLK